LIIFLSFFYNLSEKRGKGIEDFMLNPDVDELFGKENAFLSC